MERLRVDGKFLRRGSQRVFLRMVTYGPFPGGWAEDFDADFSRIRAAGFDALRLYAWPEERLLDAAAVHGLEVFAGLMWPQAVDFLSTGGDGQAAGELVGRLASTGGHPTLTGVFVANEIPADLVRWMGPARTREAIERLIATGRQQRPELIWCYANYPGTEYLEPGNADLTAMNVYLEDEAAFRAYLPRLHHLAGDRPVLISEFGLDSRRNGSARQAETLGWAIRAAHEAGLAGFTVYAWSDRWYNAGAEVLDWDFGLTDRDRQPKPALAAVEAAFSSLERSVEGPRFSVIVCTRNGAERIGACLRAITGQSRPAAEIILVDDGSDDDTAAIVTREFPSVVLLRIAPSGLSAARNAGAAAATGEVLAFTDDDCEPDADWLAELARPFAADWDAAGGPNLPPPPRDALAAVIASAPGSASHVMLDDAEAEHVPGCNLAVRRSAYFAVGGFDTRFRTAGDDVDFCWRLHDEGFRIGFAPTAFVWHHRRPSPRGYLRQQAGYGSAEALLRQKHPRRFSPSGDAVWHGVIYSGGPVRAAGDAVIYHGPMGLAGYQGLIARMQPLRDLDTAFDTPLNRALLAALNWLAPRLRSMRRIGRFRGPLREVRNRRPPPDAEFAEWSRDERETVLAELLGQGWQPGHATARWDLEKDDTRLLIATEKGDGPDQRHLFRIWGDAGLLGRPRAERLDRRP